ncbi:MAG: glycosyltransferase family 2 protein, partial [Vulcanimicrobiaceae bacterium]
RRRGQDNPAVSKAVLILKGRRSGLTVPYFSILMPTYNAEPVIGETLDCLLAQTFTDWECLVVDDDSKDDTEAVVRCYSDPRIKFIKTGSNLGYAGNLKRCFDLAEGTCLFLLGNDDILSPVCLERTYAAFEMAPDIAIVTRAYYIWDTDLDQPIRYTPQLDPTTDRIISPDDDDHVWFMLFSTIAQLSSLAIKRELLRGAVNPFCFPAHAEPFLASFRDHRGVFLKDYLLAVRKGLSQSRHVSSIYDVSPLWSWVDCFDRVFAGPRWARPRRLGRDFVAKNVQGLVQVRCKSSLTNFLREVWLHVVYRPMNLVSWRFWLFAVGCFVMPPTALRRFTDRFTPLVCRPPTRTVELAR